MQEPIFKIYMHGTIVIYGVLSLAVWIINTKQKENTREHQIHNTAINKELLQYFPLNKAGSCVE